MTARWDPGGSPAMAMATPGGLLEEDVSPRTPMRSPELPRGGLLRAGPADADGRNAGTTPDLTATWTPPPPTPTLWRHVAAQLGIHTDDGVDTHAAVRWQRVVDVMRVPPALEQFVWFGGAVCLDLLLALFTFAPLRAVVAVWTLLRAAPGPAAHRANAVNDLLRLLVFAAACQLVLQVDLSWLYHFVRGQTSLKLYVIFNVLEITDRLCSSLGQDILGSLSVHGLGGHSTVTMLMHIALATAYLVGHTSVLLCQVVTLNVAINSHSVALLPLLLSNQFVEIKSSVFKRHTPESVFQLACGDAVERFQLTTFLGLIALRNWAELGDTFSADYLVHTLLPQATVFALSELTIDWLKHAFVTKFNRISPDVYATFIDVACADLAPSASGKGRAVQGAVSHRIGFTAMPLACLLVRLALESVGSIADTLDVSVQLVLGTALALAWGAKLVVGFRLATYAARRLQRAARQIDTSDAVDRFTLSPPQPTAPEPTVGR